LVESKKIKVDKIGSGIEKKMITLNEGEKFCEVLEGPGFIQRDGGGWQQGNVLTAGAKASSSSS